MRPSIGRKYQAIIPKLLASLEECKEWPKEPTLVQCDELNIEFEKVCEKNKLRDDIHQLNNCDDRPKFLKSSTDDECFKK
tara:strand:+ start:114 stop:353 length:240 start_codon:yes stop_codon:yes gene_type:complete